MGTPVWGGQMAPGKRGFFLFRKKGRERGIKLN